MFWRGCLHFERENPRHARGGRVGNITFMNNPIIYSSWDLIGLEYHYISYLHSLSTDYGFESPICLLFDMTSVFLYYMQRLDCLSFHILSKHFFKFFYFVSRWTISIRSFIYIYFKNRQNKIWNNLVNMLSSNQTLTASFNSKMAKELRRFMEFGRKIVAIGRNYR